MIRPQRQTTVDDLHRLVENHPYGIPTEQIADELALSLDELGDPLEKAKAKGTLLGLGGLWLTPEHFETASSTFLSTLDEMHQAKPKLFGFPPGEVAVRAELPWRDKPLRRIMTELSRGRRIRIVGDLVAADSFRPTLRTKQRAFLDRIVATLDSHGIDAPSPFELHRLLNVPVQAIDEIVQTGVQSGDLVDLGESVVLSHPFLDQTVKDIQTQLSGKRLSPSEFKNHLGCSRRVAIPLLEYCDFIGLTERLDDDRLFAKRS